MAVFIPIAALILCAACQTTMRTETKPALYYPPPPPHKPVAPPLTPKADKKIKELHDNLQELQRVLNEPSADHGYVEPPGR